MDRSLTLGVAIDGFCEGPSARAPGQGSEIVAPAIAPFIALGRAISWLGIPGSMVRGEKGSYVDQQEGRQNGSAALVFYG
jgi:hypothetical protein